MIRFTLQPGSVALAIKVVPGSSRDKIVGEYDGGLKVTVSKPPEDGAANKAVVALLAKSLQIPTEQVTITHGHSRPRKIVSITGLTPDQISTRLTPVRK
jgi:uncharacterized protein (TIGR00251 family)